MAPLLTKGERDILEVLDASGDKVLEPHTLRRRSKLTTRGYNRVMTKLQARILVVHRDGLMCMTFRGWNTLKEARS